MKGNHKNYKDILEILPNNMNKGIRLDLNTHNITTLATQLARPLGILGGEFFKATAHYLFWLQGESGHQYLASIYNIKRIMIAVTYHNIFGLTRIVDS